MSISTVQSLAIQQTRREAAISSASKPLNDMAKQKLSTAPLNSSSLFGGRIDEIYWENTDSHREDLVNNAASQLSKLAKLSSFAKPKSKPKKKKNLPKEQEASKPQPTSYSQPSKSWGGNNSTEDLEVEEVAPLIEEPLPLGNTEGFAPLPLPFPLCSKLGKHNRRQVGPFFGQKWLHHSFQRKASTVPRPTLLPAASKSAAGRGSRQPP